MLASNCNICIFLTLLTIFPATFAGSIGECQHEIIESMPDGMHLNNPHGFQPILTYVSLLDIIEKSKSTLRIASFYWMLTPEKKFDGHPSVIPGKKIMDAISRAVARGVDLQVVLDNSGRRSMSSKEDLKTLRKLGTLRMLNMTHVLHAGILHSKFLIADNETFYVGSSNFDWRSYTEIKEIGISFRNCKVLAQDLDKIFRTYMLIAELNQVPDNFPDSLSTSINIDHPLSLKMGGLDMNLFLGGSPPPFNGGRQDWTGRTDDIDGLLHIINKARHRISISVMNYSPRLVFGRPKRYWPVIDDALRRAATERGVDVRLLFSNWTDSHPLELVWYKSLNALQSRELGSGGIYVKLFKVPAFDDFQRSIPYARVKHDKYMVTDNGLYIGTSNWAPDYFINTCGVGVVITPNNTSDPRIKDSSSIIKNMQDLFDRDFASEYSQDL